MIINTGLNKKNGGFTLLELLTVVSIIGLLSTIILSSISSARLRGLDARRLSDMTQIKTALEWYLDENGRYPNPDYDGCGGWDLGNKDLDLLSSGLGQVMPNPPEDPTGTGNCSGYRYYRYPAGTSGCDSKRGAFYILGVTDMESSPRPYPTSPGWSCPTRNWQIEFDWVTGGFER